MRKRGGAGAEAEDPVRTRWDWAATRGYLAYGLPRTSWGRARWVQLSLGRPDPTPGFIRVLSFCKALCLSPVYLGRPPGGRGRHHLGPAPPAGTRAPSPTATGARQPQYWLCPAARGGVLSPTTRTPSLAAPPQLRVRRLSAAFDAPAGREARRG